MFCISNDWLENICSAFPSFKTKLLKFVFLHCLCVTGACTRLEMALDRPLLWLACRHHIIELYAKAVWSAAMPASQGVCPGELLCKQFHAWWEKADNVKTTFDAADRPTLLDGKHPLPVHRGFEGAVGCCSRTRKMFVSPRRLWRASGAFGGKRELVASFVM